MRYYVVKEINADIVVNEVECSESKEYSRSITAIDVVVDEVMEYSG
jgi:hypothetical protein